LKKTVAGTGVGLPDVFLAFLDGIYDRIAMAILNQLNQLNQLNKINKITLSTYNAARTREQTNEQSPTISCVIVRPSGKVEYG